MTDFHSHILPGMDDGSKNSEQSVAMLRRLREQGVGTVVATPHFLAGRESVSDFLDRREKSRARLMKKVPDDVPRILTGAEVSFYSGMGNMTDLGRLCIEGTNILLLEMPFTRWSSYTVRELFDISCSHGVTLALAHIDRYMPYQSNDIWTKLVSGDILLQANADYFINFWTRSRAVRMLRSGMIHMIGSDCHNMSSRAPNFSDAMRHIRKRLGDDYPEHYGRQARIILENNKNLT
ncbi:MAG: capsular polysaccharide biosynthesis protein [Clostridia bacterium]|nr:capsular polysaccharide biosynthesis protein [Clostridia bacterium]